MVHWDKDYVCFILNSPLQQGVSTNQISNTVIWITFLNKATPVQEQGEER